MELRLEKRRPDDLIPYANNAKRHGNEVALIEASIQRFGFNDPIGVLPDGTVVEGHGRLMAAKALGLEEVPVLVLEGFTAQQADLYRIAHNKIALSTGFNFDMLVSNLRVLVDDEITLTAMGFDEAAASILLGQPTSLIQTQINSGASAGTQHAEQHDFILIWDTVAEKEEFDAFLQTIRQTGESVASAVVRHLEESLSGSWAGAVMQGTERANVH